MTLAEKLIGKTITISGCTAPGEEKPFPIVVETIVSAYNRAAFIVNGRYILSYQEASEKAGEV